jgi:8-oxo-dGTP pyrophosphatase MutT (NUDIX family)
VQQRIERREVKVCPVVLRNTGSSKEVLLFGHPIAGVQIVKGTLEIEDKTIEDAALRELGEESGIELVSRVTQLRDWESSYLNHLWYFVLCHIEQELPDKWEFFTNDDGGHNFSFFGTS